MIDRPEKNHNKLCALEFRKNHEGKWEYWSSFNECWIISTKNEGPNKFKNWGDVTVLYKDTWCEPTKEEE